MRASTLIVRHAGIGVLLFRTCACSFGRFDSGGRPTLERRTQLVSLCTRSVQSGSIKLPLVSTKRLSCPRVTSRDRRSLRGVGVYGSHWRTSTVFTFLTAPGSPRVAHAATPAGACFDCVMCFTSTVHLAQAGEDVIGPAHGCMDVSGNPCPHAGCNPQFAASDIERFYEAVLRNELGVIDEVIASESSVSLNTRRQALQVLGCASSVVAHIPLTAEQVAGLTELLSN